mgnify:CR=1 FL=1
MSSEIESIQDAVLQGEANKVRFLTEIALSKRIAAGDILYSGLLEPLKTISDKLKRNEVFIAEVIVVSRAVHAGLHVLGPHLKKSDEPSRGSIIIGTVAGDLHDIGKNLVAMALTSLGYQVIDLGVDVYPEDFVAAVKIHQPEYLAISAMLTTTINEISNVLKALEEENLRKKVKVIIGGNPVTSDFCFTVGADGTCYELSEIEDMIAYIDKKKRSKR